MFIHSSLPLFGQELIPEQEWDQFMSILRQPLPSTFRITGTRHVATAVRECLQQTFFLELSKALQGAGGQGEELAPPTPLPWYPDQLAWYVPLSKAFIRKSPDVSKFHRFLVDESDQGNISRQEAVSMIPPLVLDVLPHHKVLDMCAAPGSKTAQLIEMIHANDERTPSPLPSGVVVANDADNKRCYMLVHQAKRLKSPCFMVTNHDASVFPVLYHHDEHDVRCPLYYDRVLCDVPCSGDGTLRKNPTIWRSWNPALGAGLHRLQLRILNRGLELLQPGGRLVYSTCSLNPVENEAVLATILQLCRGAVELVDVSDQLPGLRTIPGMTSWKVMKKKMEWVSDTKPSSSTLFPPDPSLLPQLNLHRCVRVLPHHQDTGGFFIAVLCKSDWLPWQRRPRDSEGATATSSSCEETAPRPSVLEGEEGGGRGGEEREKPSVLMDETGGKEGEGCGEENGEPSVLVGNEEEKGGEEEGGEEGGERRRVLTGEKGGDGEKERGEGRPSGLTASEDEKERGEGAGEKAADNDGEGGGTTSRPGTAILGRPGHRHGKKGRVYREDPYVFLTDDSPVLQLIQSYYGLGDAFPSSQLLTRSVAGKKRNVYLTSRLVKELLQRNELHVKFINVGVKVLARCDNRTASCPFRICQEGIESLVPFISANRLSLTLDDLLLVLREPNPLSTGLAPPTQETLSHMGVGPALFEYTPDRSKEDTRTLYDHPIYLSGWVARKSVRLYVDKKYRCHYLAMLGHEPPQTMCLASVSGRRDCDSEEGRGGEGGGGKEEGDVESGVEEKKGEVELEEGGNGGTGEAVAGEELRT
ncbi:RNA cytosine C(5)-methyltransferase NSUN2 [Geodia barretti]|uniref:tRNA (cytosine(34)-C(5))-methyltransferase n=1 Tax=Geodia barretti TaxID=519541 RepID=A0AA35QS55_GEOBA|nr:RNA cytosine C(5)-methyltransferase NSUN2 [Geodia barretti]